MSAAPRPPLSCAPRTPSRGARILPLVALLGSGCGGGHPRSPAPPPRTIVLGDGGRESHPLTPALQRVLHTDAGTTPEGALRLDAEPVRGSFEVGPVWLRFDVTCPPGERRDWYLSLAPPFDDGVLLAERDGRWSATALPALADVPAVPLPVREGPQTFFLRTTRLSNAPPILAVATARGHARAHTFLLLAQGAYLGAAAIVVLLNAHLVRRRQRAHTLYVLYVLASAAFFSLRLGVVSRLLPDVPRSSLLLPELGSLAATVALGAQFSREFLQTAVHTPKWDRVLRAYVALSWGLAILVITTSVGYEALKVAGICLPLVSIATGLLSRARGAPWARTFLLGWSCLSLGAFAFALPSAGGLDGVVLFQAGSALEMIFLARALFVRLRALEDEQQERARTAARSERLATLGRLAVGVAHEVNNPNNLVTFNLPVLRKYLAATEPALRARAEEDDGLRLLGLPVPEFLADADALITQTEQGAKRITGIVADLKAYVRTGSSDAPREQVKIDELVERAAALVPRAHLGEDLEIHVRAAQQGLFTSAVPGRIEQVVTNLIVNAAEATAGMSPRRVDVLTRRDGASAVIEVSDSGRGLTDDARARLFEPFFTTKGRGLGLGLAISESIVREHGGTIEAVPNEPRGTRFLVRLPASPAPPTSKVKT